MRSRKQLLLPAGVLLFSLSAVSAHGLEINLDSEFDVIGELVETLMAVEVGGELRYASAIYDTGASVVTISPDAQIGLGIPVKVPDGAEAEAIGGTLIGHVGRPQTVLADGLHNIIFDFDFENLDFSFGFVDPSAAAVAPSVQTFIGTENSSLLPTITGTPIHVSGMAARIDMNGYTIDLGTLFADLGLEGLEGLLLSFPDIHFVAPDTQLPPGDGGFITDPVRIPMSPFGEDNSANPGNIVTALPNPVQTDVGAQFGSNVVAGKTLLFDTGAQLSVISSAIAEELQITESDYTQSLDVQGAAGVVTIPGLTLDALTLPIDNDGDGIAEETLTFTDATVFVLDIIEGIDGILGNNLFNTAEELLYNPFDAQGASLSVTFNTDPNRGLEGLDALDEGELLLVEAIAQSVPVFGQFINLDGPLLPGIKQSTVVPEPTALTLFSLGLLFAVMGARRQRKR